MTDMSALLRAAHRRGSMTAPVSDVAFTDADAERPSEPLGNQSAGGAGSSPPVQAAPQQQQPAEQSETPPLTMNEIIRSRHRRHIDLFNTEGAGDENQGGAAA
jgi:hypothetical protein